MKRHLTDNEIAACVAGDPPFPAAGHLTECASCNAQVTTLREALHSFRGAASLWAQAQQPAIRIPQPAPWWQPRAAWALACLALLAIVPVYRQVTPAQVTPARPRQIAMTVATHDTDSDSALLKRVNAQISRSVPAPMEPLLTLMQDN